MGDIIFTRDYDQVQRLSKYIIFINDKEVATVNNDSRKVISLKPGMYKIYIKCLNVKSAIREVEVKKHETIRLSCGSNIKGIKIVFSWIFMFSKNSIYLKDTILN